MSVYIAVAQDELDPVDVLSTSMKEPHGESVMVSPERNDSSSDFIAVPGIDMDSSTEFASDWMLPCSIGSSFVISTWQSPSEVSFDSSVFGIVDILSYGFILRCILIFLNVQVVCDVLAGRTFS
jgi:hypothetical protein